MNSENNNLPGIPKDYKSAEETMADFEIQLHKSLHDKKFIESQLNEMLQNMDHSVETEEEPNPEIDKWLDRLSLVIKEINKYTVLIDAKQSQVKKKSSI